MRPQEVQVACGVVDGDDPRRLVQVPFVPAGAAWSGRKLGSFAGLALEDVLVVGDEYQIRCVLADITKTTTISERRRGQNTTKRNWIRNAKLADGNWSSASTYVLSNKTL